MSQEVVKPKIRRTMRSFEAEKDVDEMLADAQEAGLAAAKICNEAIRRYGPEVLQDISNKAAKLAKKDYSRLRTDSVAETKKPPGRTERVIKSMKDDPN